MMTKEDFLTTLRKKISQLPEMEIEKFLAFYAEIMDDRMEEGMTEYQAVASMEDVSVISERILQETPLSLLVKTKVRPGNGWSVLTIILAVIGSPIWLPILATCVAVLISIYVVIWAVIIVFFSVVIALMASGIGLIITAILTFSVSAPFVLMVLAGGFVCIGLGIFAYFGSKEGARGLIRLTKLIARRVKSLFIRKEAAE